MTLELLPASHCSFFKFLLTTDDFKGTALWAIVDGQSQAPVAFLGDHPIVHVTQPIQFTIEAKGRDPGDLAYHIHDFIAQLLHRDEPLIYQAEDQFGMAAPACRIAVFIILLAVEQPFLDQVISNLLSYIGRALSCQPVVAREVDPKLVYRRYNSQVKFFAE